MIGRKIKQEHIIKYEWEKSGKWNSISISSSKELKPLAHNSQEHFIAEHYWGFVQVDKDKSYQFKVEHPAWKIYESNDYNIDVDFEKCYGKEFEALSNQQPSSVFFSRRFGSFFR